MKGPVFMAAVLEYLCSECLAISVEKCHEMKNKRLTPRHIELAMREDDDFARHF